MWMISLQDTMNSMLHLLFPHKLIVKLKPWIRNPLLILVIVDDDDHLKKNNLFFLLDEVISFLDHTNITGSNVVKAGKSYNEQIFSTGKQECIFL